MTAHEAPGAIHAFAGAGDFSIGTANLVGRDFVIHNSYPASNAGTDATVDDILQWLCPPNFEAIHHDVFSQRARNTCNWFLESAEFERFIEEKGLVLWGTGMPAAGKTTLVSVVIEHLKSSFGGHQDIGIAYAYLRYSENKLHRDVLLGFISQLVESREMAFAHVKPKYARAHASGSSLTEREAIQLIQDFARMLKKLFLVVDGLDEVGDETKEDLLQSLSSLGANVFIASRPLDLFEEFIPETLHISIQARTEDIRLLVLERIQRSPRLKAILRGKPEIVEQLCERIKEKSQGMFLVARLQMDALRTSNTVNSLFGTLEKLPSGINDMYEQTLARIEAQSEEDASIASRLFIWLLYAKEPPDLDELQHALAISFENLSYDRNDIVDKSIILSLCGGLVTVQPYRRKVRFNNRGQVRFIHYTTREFMEKAQFPRYPHPHNLLAVSCTVYCVNFAREAMSRGLELASDRTYRDPYRKVHVQEDDQDSVVAASVQFFEYTHSNWHLHAADAQLVHGHTAHPFIISFIANCRESRLPWCCSEHNSPLGVAVHFNLWIVVSSGQLPYSAADLLVFRWAALNCRIEVLEALYAAYGHKLYFDSPEQGRSGCMHLHYLVRTGRADLVEELLFTSPSSPFLPTHSRVEDFVNSRDAEGLTPLMIACSNDISYLVSVPGHTLVDIEPFEVLDQLLEFGCDIRAQDNDGVTAFLRVVNNIKSPTPWHLVPNPYQFRTSETIFYLDNVMERLLAFDPAMIDQRDAIGRTALMLLAGPEDSADMAVGKIQTFLAYAGPDVQWSFANAKDRNGDSVLVHASWSPQVVESLCTTVPFNSTTISDALMHAFNPDNWRSQGVACVLLRYASSPAKDLFRHGWASNLAIILLAYASKHPCRCFLWLLLLCCCHGHQAISRHSCPQSGYCRCEVCFPPPPWLQPWPAFHPRQALPDVQAAEPIESESAESD